MMVQFRCIIVFTVLTYYKTKDYKLPMFKGKKWL